MSLKQAEQPPEHKHQHQQHQQQQHEALHQQMRTRVEQCGNQILRVRGDSDLDMEALFSVLQNKNCALAISSFKNRKLPASFFRPPEPKPCPQNHDCGNGGVGNDCGAHCKGLVHISTSTSSHSPAVSHCRSMSSPVQLLHSHNSPPQHIRQSSMDGCTEEFSSTHHNAWDMLRKCPKYQVKCWSQEMHSGGYIPLAERGLAHQVLDPHHHHHHHHQQQQQHVCQNHSHQSVELSKHQELGPLPPGWEQGLTPEGELYFINHLDKTTSWYDPRLPRHVQTMASNRICQAPAMLEQHLPQFSQQPDYLSQQQQQQQQRLPNTLAMSHAARRPVANEQYLCIQLQKLQQEKERLQQEQEAIACREMMLNELVRNSASSAPGDVQMKCMSTSCALNPGQGIQSPCASGLDPFLGQACPGTMESHVRQNSTDSGLGGMGTTYSLPRSPDDYLSNVEELDLPEGSYKLPLPQNSGYSKGNLNLEMTAVSEMADILESGHLISSLGEELENELFSEMDDQKINNLLWL